MFLKGNKTNYSIVPVGDVREGTILVADDGFACLDYHQICVVRCDEAGEFYVDCEEGMHNLESQWCDKGEHGVDFEHYIGFWVKGTEPAQ